MKLKKEIHFFLLLLGFLMAVPFFAFAMGQQVPTGQPNTPQNIVTPTPPGSTSALLSGPACKVETPSLWPAGYWGTNPSLLPCGVLLDDGVSKVDCLQCGLCGFLMLGQRIIYLMISILFFLVAPVRFIWGGILIMISRGSTEMFSRGQKMIYQTVIGLMIGLGAFLIVQTFLWLLGRTGASDQQKLGWPTINCQRNLKP